MNADVRQTGEAAVIEVIRAGERGHFDHGWLDTYHTFSFGDYHDPRRMGFGALRVINEDRVAPGRGFGTHPHRDMEIVTYVLEGALAHRDSLGHGGLIRAGEMQRITAGTGITHSEQNASTTEPVHFYQIWLFPNRKGLEPGYEQKALDPAGRRGRSQVIASKDGREGSMIIHQDAELSIAGLAPGEMLSQTVPKGRQGWLQVLRGNLHLDDLPLGAGDGAMITGGPTFRVKATTETEWLLFDLA